MMPAKLLIIRFSSFGDIVQCYGAAETFAATFPDAEIHWVVRSDMKELVEIFPRIKKVWAFWRNPFPRFAGAE